MRMEIGEARAVQAVVHTHQQAGQVTHAGRTWATYGSHMGHTWVTHGSNSQAHSCTAAQQHSSPHTLSHSNTQGSTLHPTPRATPATMSMFAVMQGNRRAHLHHLVRVGVQALG